MFRKQIRVKGAEKNKRGPKMVSVMEAREPTEDLAALLNPRKGERTNMLSWGFATEGVCVRGGPHVAKADNE
jgi:hypothetical protein